MSPLFQGLLVGLIVAACGIYSAWRLVSLRLRLRVIDGFARLPEVLTAPWLPALRQRTLARLAGGCAGCAAGGGLTPDAAVRPNRTPGAPRR